MQKSNELRRIALSEQVGEVFRVEFGESLAVVDRLTDYQHGGEGELVLVDDLGKVF